MCTRRRVWSSSSLSPDSTSRTMSTPSLTPCTVLAPKVRLHQAIFCYTCSSVCVCVCVEGGSLPRQKRRHGGSHSASRDVQAVYRKLTEVVENLALLLETQPLTDTTVLQVETSLVLSPWSCYSPPVPTDLFPRHVPFLCRECQCSAAEFTASGQSCKYTYCVPHSTS